MPIPRDNDRPSPRYDNAWLAARQKKQQPDVNDDWTGQRYTGPDQVTDIMHSPEEQARRRALADDGPEMGDPLAGAKAYLNQPPEESVNVRDIAEMESNLSGLKELQNAPGAVRPWSLSDITGGLAETGAGMQAASLSGLVPSSWAPIARKLTLPLAAAGEVLQAPENIRAGIEDPSQAMGVGEGALRMGGLLLGGKLGRRQPKPRPSVKYMEGPSRYDSAGSAVDSPNFQRAGAIDPPPADLPESWQPFAQPAPAPRPTPGMARRAQAPRPSMEPAASEIGRPGAQNYMTTQAAKNSEQAYQDLGASVNPQQASYDSWQRALDSVMGPGGDDLLSPLDRLSRIRQRGEFARSRPRDVR